MLLVCFLIKYWLLSCKDEPTATCRAGNDITGRLTLLHAILYLKNKTLNNPKTDNQVTPESSNIISLYSK